MCRRVQRTASSSRTVKGTGASGAAPKGGGAGGRAAGRLAAPFVITAGAFLELTAASAAARTARTIRTARTLRAARMSQTVLWLRMPWGRAKAATTVAAVG